MSSTWINSIAYDLRARDRRKEIATQRAALIEAQAPMLCDEITERMHGYIKEFSGYFPCDERRQLTFERIGDSVIVKNRAMPVSTLECKFNIAGGCIDIKSESGCVTNANRMFFRPDDDGVVGIVQDECHIPSMDRVAQNILMEFLKQLS